MNRENLNVATLNAAPLDFVQRVTVTMVAVASAIAGARVFRRNVFAATGRAAITATRRAILRAIISATPAAAIGLGGQEFVRGRCSVTGRATVVAIGTAYPRQSIYAPTLATPRAVVVVNLTRTIMRSPRLVQAVAEIVARSNGYTRHRSPLAVSAQALVAIDFDVNKLIPYDEDAPAERVMTVSEDSRLMTVI